MEHKASLMVSLMLAVTLWHLTLCHPINPLEAYSKESKVNTDVVDLEERPLYHLSDLPTQTGMAADSDKMRAIIHKLIDDIMSRPEDSSESSQNAPTKRRMMEFLGKRSPERMEGIYDNEQKRKYMEFLG